jgi:hypothetical protein
VSEVVTGYCGYRTHPEGPLCGQVMESEIHDSIMGHAHLFLPMTAIVGLEAIDYAAAQRAYENWWEEAAWSDVLPRIVNAALGITDD